MTNCRTRLPNKPMHRTALRAAADRQTVGLSLDKMSIYATLWRLKFPRYGDVHTGCEWIEVTAQGVPAHIGSSTLGLGYENGDPYADFLPPALFTDDNGEAEFMRAVVIITEETEKGTARHPQVYSSPPS